MRPIGPAVRWIVDKLLRLAAAAVALALMPTALLGGREVDNAQNILSLIAALAIMFFGFAFAFLLLAASVAFWPSRSPNSKTLKRPALIVVSIIYLAGTCGIVFAGTTLLGLAYLKSHALVALRIEQAK